MSSSTSRTTGSINLSGTINNATNGINFNLPNSTANDRLVGLTSTDILTNKTLTSATLAGTTNVGVSSGNTTTIGGASATTNINNATVANSTLSGAITNSATITGGTISNATHSNSTLTGTSNIGTAAGNSNTIGGASATTNINNATVTGSTINGTTSIGATSGNSTTIGGAGATTAINNATITSSTVTSATITSPTNNVTANALQNNTGGVTVWQTSMGGSAPTTNQVLQYNGTSASWVTLPERATVGTGTSSGTTATTLTNPITLGAGTTMIRAYITAYRTDTGNAGSGGFVNTALFRSNGSTTVSQIGITDQLVFNETTTSAFTAVYTTNINAGVVTVSISVNANTATSTADWSATISTFSIN